MSWVLAIPMATLTAAWYVHNGAAAYRHLQASIGGPAATGLWGKEDTYLNTLAYWGQTAREINFLPGLAELSLLIVVSAVVLYAARRERAPTHFSLCAGVAALQIVTVVMVFSLSTTRQNRYLLPALPYVALVIGWSLAQINRGWVTALGFAGFAIQFVLLHGQGTEPPASGSSIGTAGPVSGGYRPRTRFARRPHVPGVQPPSDLEHHRD